MCSVINGTNKTITFLFLREGLLQASASSNFTSTALCYTNCSKQKNINTLPHSEADVQQITSLQEPVHEFHLAVNTQHWRQIVYRSVERLR
jgi:hypothetical protein